LFPACSIRPNNQQKELLLEFEILLNFAFFKVAQMGKGDAFGLITPSRPSGKAGFEGNIDRGRDNG